MQPWLAWTAVAVRRHGWAPIAVFLLHVVLSRLVGAYAQAPWLDLPMHVAGGVAIAHFFRGALLLPEATAVVGAPSRPGRFLLALALVCTSAVVWEFLEWTGDALGLTSAQAGLDDTMLDMALGAAGGVLYLAARSSK